MGWNTTVLVLNDRLQQIEKDPNFGQSLVDAISMCKIRQPYLTGQTTVIAQHHADDHSLLVVGENMGKKITLDSKFQDLPGSIQFLIEHIYKNRQK